MFFVAHRACVYRLCGVTPRCRTKPTRQDRDLAVVMPNSKAVLEISSAQLPCGISQGWTQDFNKIIQWWRHVFVFLLFSFWSTYIHAAAPVWLDFFIYFFSKPTNNSNLLRMVLVLDVIQSPVTNPRCVRRRGCICIRRCC